MVPLFVVLTILGFLAVDFIYQKATAPKRVLVPKFNPATDMMWNGGLPSMADGGDPIPEKDEKKDEA